MSALAALNIGSVAAAAQGSACDPPDLATLGSEQPVGFVEATDGDEITLHYSGGRYVVKRCDANGNLVVSQEVAPVEVPGGNFESLPTAISEPGPDGGVSTLFIEYGSADDPDWAADWARTGHKDKGRSIPPTRGEMKPTGAPQPEADAPAGENPPADAFGGWKPVPGGSPGGTECTDGSWVSWDGRGSDEPLVYFVQTAPFPGSTPAQKAVYRDRIADAAAVWNATWNRCGYGDQRNVWLMYANSEIPGETASTTRDGISVIDYGNTTSFCGSSTAVACVYLHPGSAEINEIDMRFSNAYNWYNGTSTSIGTSHYDFTSTAVHEFGHVVGLGHVGNCDLTMGSPCAAPGQTHRRLPGAGDVLGLRSLNPNGQSPL